jgi:hypothetical protein
VTFIVSDFSLNTLYFVKALGVFLVVICFFFFFFFFVFYCCEHVIQEALMRNLLVHIFIIFSYCKC